MAGIIVGVDGSAHSRRALEWAIKEAAIKHAPLTVLTVHQLVAGWSGRGVMYADDNEQAERLGRVAKQDADKLLAELTGSRPESVTVRAISGFPAEELLTASKDADLVVLGSRGAGGFAQLMMGSVSAQVAHHAHCPVVIIPPEGRN
jgi:nucleotide-binding universal stress UspA family protein